MDLTVYVLLYLASFSHYYVCESTLHANSVKIFLIKWGK